MWENLIYLHTLDMSLKNSSLAGHIACFWTYFERCASLLGLDVLRAKWHIRLSRSGSNLIHGKTL